MYFLVKRKIVRTAKVGLDFLQKLRLSFRRSNFMILLRKSYIFLIKRRQVLTAKVGLYLFLKLRLPFFTTNFIICYRDLCFCFFENSYLDPHDLRIGIGDLAPTPWPAPAIFHISCSPARTKTMDTHVKPHPTTLRL